VQDFDPEVQRLVNRHQPYEVTKSITDIARELGYSFGELRFDLRLAATETGSVS
jgi:coproporphyrinogen III oxidase/oxygen-independent coproporphyrinogen-3 oxidase